MARGVLKFILLGVTIAIVSVLALWVFDPALENFVEKRIDVVDKKNYRALDKYVSGDATPASDIELSVVIPAYNEEKRIVVMLDEALHHLQSSTLKYEIIVVDDGSKDKTGDICVDYYNRHPDVFRYLKLVKNQGKGAAVKLGVAASLGKYVLFADADGATEFRDVSKLLNEIGKIERGSPALNGDKVGIVAGSRAHLEEKSIASREWYRTILMRGFHFYVSAMVTSNVRDTQCGFKLFTAKAAKVLFANLHLYRWAFDIELVYLAERLGVPIAEVAVNWHEVEGSKLIKNKADVVITSLTMARDILCLRLSYLVGFWRLDVNGSGSVTRSEL